VGRRTPGQGHPDARHGRGRPVPELAALGYRDRDQPVALETIPVGGLDRDGMAEQVLARLAAGRSAWNAADIRADSCGLFADSTPAGTALGPGLRG
jgi:exodeoxyribonuclease V alpha subunit